MGKRVILALNEGSFEEGFTVMLRIKDDDEPYELQFPGKLPRSLNILEAFNKWESTYGHWQTTYRQAGLQNYRIKPKPGVTNCSCRQSGLELSECLNEWLNSDSRAWQEIQNKLQRKLNETDEIRLIIETDNVQLRQLPWHLWDLFSNHYKNAEITLSSLRYESPQSKSRLDSPVRILAILGDSTGINIQQDREFLEKLQDAKITFLVEPSRQELNKQLWEKHWDILFFAGHSFSQADGMTGQISINRNDSLPLTELKNALTKTIRGGLKLAIFNSCDGLGLAREIADLNIPQIIVMRMPVPNLVAQEFLQCFLEAFTKGKPLHLAVREARERLQALEDKFPCASWLPVICQNSNAEPLIWQKLGHLKPKHSILPSWLHFSPVHLFLLSVVAAFGLWVSINNIDRKVLGPIAEQVKIFEAINDLAKSVRFSEIRNAVLQDVFKRSGIPMSELFVRGEQANWPDKCLGLADPTQFCAQVSVPGWRVTVESKEQRWVYRTFSSGTFVKLDMKDSQINTLYPNGSLRKGEFLTSNNGRYKLILQEDGNLVLYEGNQAIWASMTNGKTVNQCIMQENGNFIIYSSKAIWASHTAGQPGAYLILQDDRNVVIYTPDYKPIWATNTMSPSQ